MSQKLLVPCGWLGTLMGAGMLVPVVISQLEGGRTGVAVPAVAFAAVSLAACGVTAIAFGTYRRTKGEFPAGVRLALTSNVLVLAFLALELSDRIVRQHGQVFYWTTFLLPPALILYAGLLAAQSWGWVVARGVAGVGTLWFLAFSAMIPFVHLQAGGVPTPWYGRLYMIGVSLGFAAILAAAFRSLGAIEVRRYFGRAS